MIRTLIALLVAMMSICVTDAKTLPFESIKPLHVYDKEGKTLEATCTAFAVRVGDFTLWVTCWHCIAAFDHETGTWDANEDGVFKIGDKPARLHSGNAEVDIAALIGPSAPGLRVAFSGPSLRFPAPILSTFGYPHRAKAGHMMTGTYGGRDDDGLEIYSMSVAPGMSGAPILDKDGFVVGVMAQHECEYAVSSPVPFPIQVTPAGFCSVSRGARLEYLRRFLYGE